MNIFFWTGFDVEEVEQHGSKKGGEDEQDEAKPILEAEDASDSACEARRDELDVVYRIGIEEDMRTEKLLLLLGGQRVRVGVLGATGTVGQRFIVLLKIIHGSLFTLLAHQRGRRERNTLSPQTGSRQLPYPPVCANSSSKPCEPEHFQDCAIVFSGLDADVAGDIARFSSYRRDPDVPLIVPLVNPTHLKIIPQQRASHSPPLKKGFVANASTTGVVIPLAALERAFGPIESCIITTLQAISGAGYPGVPPLTSSTTLFAGEEEKLEWETLKILGGLKDVAEGASGDTGVLAFDLRADSPIRISASCTRVPVIEGHTETVFAPSPQQVRDALAAYTTEVCPSAPRHAIWPRLDRAFQQGAGVSVGRVRQCPVLDIKFVVLSNNVNIGAATSSIMNAEIALTKNMIVI
ncbi:hypothetical protein B0F90DRAFT_1812118 [Multifurca ochricompacta]|uniref:aspartate-semialdehyde dehydrogenase n=1 Tax=Multifurca ochricompacta TaxID=376703 RepID=A0AAD4QJB5_9AGAM|nr:hypothetical protein B0F90DRAFT_1812118 [Multifurca ochricompacta]